jgi:hypothetical protein
MPVIKKLKKEIDGITKYGDNYKVKNLKFNDRDLLFGTIIINGEYYNFTIDFTNEEKTEYKFNYAYYRTSQLNDCIRDFYEKHITQFKINKLDKNENIIIERIIKIS